jgi:toxin ParE1/3/4
MKLRFTLRATQDLVDIADYIRARNPAAALRVRNAILDSLRNLTLWPEIGRRQTVAGVRKLVTRKYPYLVYYTVNEPADEIIVLTIQHPARERSYEDA